VLEVVVNAVGVCCHPGLDAFGDVDNILQLGREDLMQLLRRYLEIEVDESVG